MSSNPLAPAWLVEPADANALPTAVWSVNAARSAAGELHIAGVAASDLVRAAQPFGNLRTSQRPDLYSPGIHLHHTLDAAAMAAEGLDDAAGSVQVLDASALTDIGAEHHSFKTLVSAYARVQRRASGGTLP